MGNIPYRKCVDSTGREFSSIAELCKYHSISQGTYYNTRKFQNITEPAEIVDYCLSRKAKNYKNNLKNRKRRVNDIRKHTSIDDIRKLFAGEKKSLW